MRREEGFYLPTVAVVISLMLVSGLIVSTATRQSRGVVARSQAAGAARDALASAELEVLAEPLPASFLEQLTPPFAPLVQDHVDVEPALTRAAFAAQGVRVEPATVSCVHRGSKNGWCQGLVLVTTSVVYRTWPRREVTRTRRSWLRYYTDAARVVVLPGPLCVKEDE